MKARREDVDSIEGIVRALYEVVSGPAGPRDWERERSLVHPQVRLMPTHPRAEGGAEVEVMDSAGYIASRSPVFAASPFWENEVCHRVERFGNIAHVWSTYESRQAPAEKPFARGINSIQLFHDGDRWWVMSVLWDNEGGGNPLPARYLRNGTL
ncbi:MAG TPA: hypothetical protein VF173_31175 [Thermoanaerobaculia bacterium]|nr:hypothetical protein [Thermoanaerobaculia bacterium]